MAFSSPHNIVTATFRAKTLPAGGATYEAARERDHDDIVLAVAMATASPSRA
jgi:hypothetical protein